MIISLMTLAVVGILLSAYALYVDRKIDRKADYKAVCDINDRVSCSRAFKS